MTRVQTKDILSEIQMHVRVSLLGLVLAVTAMILATRSPDPVILFALIQVAIGGLLLYCVFPSPLLRKRVAWLWPLLAIIAACLGTTSESGGGRVAGDVGAVAMLALVLLILCASLWTTIRSYRRQLRNRSGAIAALYIWFSWGLTLQIATMITVWIIPIVRGQLNQTSLGFIVVEMLDAIRLSSPWSWCPIGMSIVVILIIASAELSLHPYTPQRFHANRAGMPLAMNVASLPLRYIGWLVGMSFGFLSQLMIYAWSALRGLLDRWIGQAMLVAIALVVPVSLILLAHSSVMRGLAGVSEYLSHGDALVDGHVTPSVNSITVVVYAHVNIAIGVAAYILAIPTLGLRVQRMRLALVARRVARYWKSRGSTVFESVARLSCLSAFLVICVPVTALLSPWVDFGLISWLYGMLVVAALVYGVIHRRGLQSSQR